MNAQDLDTPALYVDLSILERNIAGMQARARAWGLHLRPRTGAHRVAEIARQQLSAGAIGFAAGTISEAAALPADDWLISYPVFGDKARRLREFAGPRRAAIVVDSVEAAREAGEIAALIKIQLGGDDWGAPSAAATVEIARACQRFVGLSYCHGSQQTVGLDFAQSTLAAALTEVEHVGLKASVVSARTMVGLHDKAEFVTQTTEIRPGEYVFNDAAMLRHGACTEADCALRVLVGVVSTTVRGQCIIDAGSKTFSNNATPGAGTFGHFVGRPWIMRKMNEEHGFVSIEGTARVGEKAWVIPSRAGGIMNMHDVVWFGRDGKVEGNWPVTARGKVR